MGNVPLRNDC